MAATLFGKEGRFIPRKVHLHANDIVKPFTVVVFQIRIPYYLSNWSAMQIFHLPDDILVYQRI